MKDWGETLLSEDSPAMPEKTDWQVY